MYDVPELPFFPRDCVRREWMGLPDRCSLTREAAVKRQAAHRDILRRVAERHPSARIFDPYDALCPAQTCAYRSGDHLLYSDSHHLTTHGSAVVAKGFLDWLVRKPQ